MIYIYDDYAGTHGTSLAAAYHLKKLTIDRTLTKEEILIEKTKLRIQKNLIQGIIMKIPDPLLFILSILVITSIGSYFIKK